MKIISTTAILFLMALLCGAILSYAARRLRVRGDPLVDAIDSKLPQTQCGQCGYPGCRPYAEAIAKGEAESTSAPPAARPASALWPSSSGAK